MAVKKILIVDDEEDIRRLVSEALKRNEGYSISIAQDGLQALAAAHEQKPDLVILDIRLPQIDGSQVCRLLRFDATLSHIKILMITGDAQNWDTQEALLVGADAYLPKPFSVSALVKKVGELLGGGAGDKEKEK